MSGPYEPLGQYDVISKQTNENLKQQCEKALHELNQLRRQHTETSRRCEHVMKELEYFRGQHRAAMNQLEVSAQEASSLRGKYGDLLDDNQRFVVHEKTWLLFARIPINNKNIINPFQLIKRTQDSAVSVCYAMDRKIRLKGIVLLELDLR
ncbi:hypothetical protein evm_007667 [Chilo suppressalis]|nr:hypothetical protein evm_007667 [Chilo suppressalis]